MRDLASLLLPRALSQPSQEGGTTSSLLWPLCRELHLALATVWAASAHAQESLSMADRFVRHPRTRSHACWACLRLLTSSLQDRLCLGCRNYEAPVQVIPKLFLDAGGGANLRIPGSDPMTVARMFGGKAPILAGGLPGWRKSGQSGVRVPIPPYCAWCLLEEWESRGEFEGAVKSCNMVARTVYRRYSQGWAYCRYLVNPKSPYSLCRAM